MDVHSIRLDQSKGAISQVYGGGLDRWSEAWGILVLRGLWSFVDIRWYPLASILSTCPILEDCWKSASVELRSRDRVHYHGHTTCPDRCNRQSNAWVPSLSILSNFNQLSLLLLVQNYLDWIKRYTFHKYKIHIITSFLHIEIAI